MLTTKAIGYEHNLPLADPNSFIEREIPTAKLGPHDILVEVKAISVNPADVKKREGSHPRAFTVLGYDAAGVVAKVGKQATLFSPGDEVWYAGTIDRPGTNQQYHVVDERIVGRKPANLSFKDAASLPLVSITAYEVLFERLQLNAESAGTLLIVGATGGVGAAMLQLAEQKLPKVTVIATASSPERAAWATRLGAEYTVNHREDLVAQVGDIAPGGVDWLFTSHSEKQLSTYAKIMRPFGHIVAIDDGPRNVSPLKAKSITWHWELMFTRPMFHTTDMIKQHEILDEVAELAETGKIVPTIYRALTPISAATLREAHRIVGSGGVLGKVVLSDWE